MSIKRIFVEKKQNAHAKDLFFDIKENLRVDTLSGVRALKRYDIENISEEDYRKCLHTIFSEPPVDNVYEEDIELTAQDTMFAIEYLPGQYDQRADSCMQCIQVVSEKEPPLVSIANVYILSGNISEKDLQTIKNYCINPVDSREAAEKKPQSLALFLNQPQDIAVLDGFTNQNKEELHQLREQLSLAMSPADLLHLQAYFKKDEKRDPTVSEVRVIDTYWSDHCRHTTFLTKIETITIEDGMYKKPIEQSLARYLEEREKVNNQKDICLMDIAVTGMKSLKKDGFLTDLDESDEINACSIVCDVDVNGKNEEWLVMFKNETHNHPTEIEPFGGAATCLGGAIRDPLSGRSYVYQAMRVTGASDPTASIFDTLKGKLPQKKITKEAAHGYSSYGNQIGIATGHVAEIYHKGYVAKRMEIGVVMGAAPKSYVVRSTPEPSDVVILVGGRTGRDGCGGATGSSKEHDIDSIANCGAQVQKGNPVTERKLQRLFRNPQVSRMIKKCNDFGAGGVAVAIGELADGLMINLDDVPKKYEGLDGTELAISESQERMAVIVSKEMVEQFIQFANLENIEATPVAVVTEEPRLIMKWWGREIVNISRHFLNTNGATAYTKAIIAHPSDITFFKEDNVAETNIKDAFIQNLKDLNVASQKGLVEMFDSTIGNGTVLMPFGGKKQLTPAEVMAAKIPVLYGETTTATAVSYGFNPKLSEISPYHGAVYAVVESLCKIVAAGGDYKKCRLSFQEYFESLGNDPYKWGKPLASLLGALQAQMEFKTPSIGGKDSMSGTFMDLHVPPTLVSFAVNVLDVRHIISPEFKNTDNRIVLIQALYDQYWLPDYDELKKNFERINELIVKGHILSAHTVRQGGVGEAVCKMCFGNSIGAVFDEKFNENLLFKPLLGSFVVEIDGECDINQLLDGINFFIIGQTVEDEKIVFGNTTISLDDLLVPWQNVFEKVFPTVQPVDRADNGIEISGYSVQTKQFPKIKIAKPTVLIPVFPGTNTEWDAASAFLKAGAKVSEAVVKNLTTNAMQETIQEMAKKINGAQMLMFPGGFSAGDEPDGSGKFIAAFFRNPYIAEAVTKLLQERDGLILGICNGFQALIKLGLLPFGEIRDMDENSPTLTVNSIGRHISSMVDTKIISNLSPWLYQVNVGEIYKVPMSHGEGRFFAKKPIVEELIRNHQVAVQYVNNAGSIANLNGSYYAIEAISSPDGKILGKMCHSERIGNYLYKNIDGEFDQKIFLSGVNYYQ